MRLYKFNQAIVNLDMFAEVVKSTSENEEYLFYLIDSVHFVRISEEEFKNFLIYCKQYIVNEDLK